VENFGEEIIKYGYEQFSSSLKEVFEGKKGVKMTLRKAGEFARRNSSYEIGRRFIELFEKLLKS